MQVLTMQGVTLEAREVADWDQVLLLQVGDLVQLSAVEVFMLVVAGMLLVLVLALGVESVSRQTQDVESAQDQPTRPAV